MKTVIEKFKKLKLDHEMPNDNTCEYNQGYVKAMNDAINTLEKSGSSPDEIRQHYKDNYRGIYGAGRYFYKFDTVEWENRMWRAQTDGYLNKPNIDNIEWKMK